MTEFCTQVHGGKSYQITVKTDNKEHYLRIQQAARECVDNASTVDAVPVVHGKWIYDRWCEFKCSCCGHFSSTKPRGKEKYCPNCGAKMDEVSE